MLFVREMQRNLSQSGNGVKFNHKRDLCSRGPFSQTNLATVLAASEIFGVYRVVETMSNFPFTESLFERDPAKN